jgi:hypothetical protein
MRVKQRRNKEADRAKLRKGLAWAEAAVMGRLDNGVLGTSSRIVFIVDFAGAVPRRVTLGDTTELHDVPAGEGAGNGVAT